MMHEAIHEAIHEVMKRLPPLTIIAMICAGCSESAPRAPSAPASAAPAAQPASTHAVAPPAAESPTGDPPASRPATSRPATPPGPTSGAPAPPVSTASPPVAEPGDPTVAVFAGYEAPKPVTWIWQPPQNRMRAANYVVPGASGEDQAHFVVYQGIGGGAEANVTRWTGQFRSPSGEPVEPILQSMEVSEMTVTIVELAGEYMATGARWFTPDQLFLAAVVEGPHGQIQAILSGRTSTVESNRDAFMTLVQGLRFTGTGG